jgi:CBS domain-containing protein
MKVREAMTSDVSYCYQSATLTDAAIIMWQRDCGVVPIVNEQKQIIGMITDRDICIAVATRNQLPSQISVGEIGLKRKIGCCAPDDDAEDALKIMKKYQLRRLPVVNKEDKILLGILSVSDLLRYAGKGNNAVSRKKLLVTLKEISSFRPLHMHELSTENIADKNKTEDFYAVDDEDPADDEDYFEAITDESTN